MNEGKKKIMVIAATGMAFGALRSVMSANTNENTVIVVDDISKVNQGHELRESPSFPVIPIVEFPHNDYYPGFGKKNGNKRKRNHRNYSH